MLRVGLIGAGFMGTFHAAGWSRTPAGLAGINSFYPDRGEALARRYGARLYESLDALLDAVDVLDVCTPTYLHHEMVLKAAAAGKHVICEKPLARTISQAEEMILACREAGVKLLVGHVVRFFPQYAQAKAIVSGGEIGRVGVIRLTRASSHPERPYDNWFLDPARSGGMMLDLMLHDFDYARWIAGEVESVFAKKVSSHYPGVPGDYGLAILRHTDGALSHIEGGWVYPPPMFRTSLEIAGEHGLIELPAEGSQPLGLYLHRTEGDDPVIKGVPLSPLAEDPYTTELRHFYDVLVHDVTPRITAEDALAALRIAFAAIRSAETGRRVALEEVH
ncbi:MAG: Gfo/Idh/MocA family oxidoreductase [Chloroflexi bacterium]|nr:Gfo/Idh/MocA family oxidoreductase [Chloroflexota bacterium]